MQGTGIHLCRSYFVMRLYLYRLFEVVCGKPRGEDSILDYMSCE
jgi:hypothetical protein